MEDSIKMLMDNNILLIGILFNKTTYAMFEEIKKIYRDEDKEELLLLANLQGTSEGKIW